MVTGLGHVLGLHGVEGAGQRGFLSQCCRRIALLVFLGAAGVGACDSGGASGPTAYGDSVTQGQLLWTDRAMDLALEGPGMLMVGNGAERRYVRGGRFRLDERSRLLDEHGRALQGHSISSDGTALRDELQSILIEPGSPPRATSEIYVDGNLDAAAVHLPVAFDAYNPGATSEFSTALEVYDSNGDQHSVGLYFTKTGPDRWSWYAIVQNDQAHGGNVVTQTAPGGTGELLFDETGTLLGSGVGSSLWTFPLAMPQQEIRLNFGSSLRQDMAPSAMRRVSQDREFTGRRFVNVLADGALRVFQSGATWTLAYVPVVTFRNFGGLRTEGAGVYVETQESGPAEPGAPAQQGRGLPLAGFVELH